MDKGQTWRQRLYIIIFETSTPAAQRFDNWLLVTILASLVVVMLDSVEHFHNQYAEVFRALEWFFTVLFAIEYGLRLYISPKPMRYAFSFFGLVDLLAVLPAILALMFADAQYLMIVRAIRLIRVFRVLKLRQYLSQANFLLVALRGSKQILILPLLTDYGLMEFIGTIV
ncbi:ion transporter, partial [Ectopseudomonas hydrolytica]|uniref:ion transporter n=1 Tax=Ectopseudomonas hydrolytica TaxID=2493633 RepID=UPI003C2BBC91